MTVVIRFEEIERDGVRKHEEQTWSEVVEGSNLRWKEEVEGRASKMVSS